ncbi:unnamed protein product [Albugo candida]|uniref:RRM domain-containing protein n=1 Tax=Albugo candida TaxID=65357 RepID=A0A024GGP1_9STRA|nr:unnamed protein product [Albugo candida]|eukprot:CCI45505.1 unnamed protein product [Albugo candida]
MKSSFALPSGKLASWADEDDDDNMIHDPIESDIRQDDSREENNEEVKVYPQTRRESRTYQSTEIPRDPPYKIRVANLPSDVREDDLVDLFGTKARFHVPMPRKNGSGRGRVAFVEFENREDAVKALDFKHHEMRRNCLEISVAEERYNSGGRGRGRGRRQQSAGRVNTSSYRGDRDSDRRELLQDIPKGRPKLHILPRSIEKDSTGERTTANKNIFGDAKARDEIAFQARQQSQQQSQAAESSTYKIQKRLNAKIDETQTETDSEIVSKLDDTTLDGARPQRSQSRNNEGRGRGGRGRGSGRQKTEVGDRDRDRDHDRRGRGRGRGRHSSTESGRVYRPRRASEASQSEDVVLPTPTVPVFVSKNKEQKKSLKATHSNKGKQKTGINEKNIFNLLGASDSDAV